MAAKMKNRNFAEDGQTYSLWLLGKFVKFRVHLEEDPLCGLSWVHELVSLSHHWYLGSSSALIREVVC